MCPEPFRDTCPVLPERPRVRARATMEPMTHLTALTSLRRIDAFAAALPRSADQVNGVHRADAELVRMADGSLLAATVDGLCEEVALGLLRDPRKIGWAAVVHGLSDLAAVAACPLGVLLSCSFPSDVDEELTTGIAAGAGEALREHGTACLGGDMNEGPTAIHCTALGRVESDQVLTREGALPGDRLYATGVFGVGHLVGTLRETAARRGRDFEDLYKPYARLEHARVARPFARAAIDTSDGLLASADLLARVNGVGVALENRPTDYHPALLTLLAEEGLPAWTGAAFGMGEYELLLAVAPESSEAFEAAMEARELFVHQVGRVVEEPGLFLRLEGALREVDGTRAMNLFGRCADVDEYLTRLGELDAELRAAPEVDL